MSDVSQSDQPGSFRAAVDLFLKERLSDKLEKLASDDPKRNELIEQYQRDVWVSDAARRVSQIQAVTHSLKPIHPDAKGTNLYVAPKKLASLDLVGSHALGEQFDQDVVGNAAALDVYKFLRLQCKGKTLLDALLEGDSDAMLALSNDNEVALALKDAFIGLVATRSDNMVSHVLAKQLYWCVENDPCNDGDYHLVAPLYPTSLVHSVYTRIQDARFGETNKAVRDARRGKKHFDGVLIDYLNLAVQKLGGTKPQNISQLNSERKGNNYLLSSAPPQWTSSSMRLPKGHTSIFTRIYDSRPEVRVTIRALIRFLEDAPQNVETRTRVERYIGRLTGELIALAGEMQMQLEAGWSRDVDYENLPRYEKLWLDPKRVTLSEEDEFAGQWLQMDWPSEVAKRFSQWINNKLAGKYAVGDAEAQEWKKLLQGELEWEQQLRSIRVGLDGPAHAYTRQSHQELTGGGQS